ncbi:gamma-glutamyltransferase [Peptoniphilus indolicus]|uniref:Glutathione hydrolase proenzyme n=2 Tax=Peptoniphilus indolicus TaxID=33030 RepID=G4D110_9FIRM|nr:gamma-glutamyltransferase [Peptoniphilus indolicus]EGY80789.1 gamma-glutamyltranspeptidase [Peptoniphilus indolicus ATCC 29427]SUB74784.1 Gamma-glutamyltranspeptidase precursor [Peptoniphilus indolicus]
MIRKRLPIWTLVLSLMVSALSPIGTYAATREPVKDNGTGLVMSTNPLANKVGKEVLDKGGNAIDAAVAVGYMLAVVHPAAGNIGGGGFALIHTEDGKDVALDFRETAPAKATRDMYLDKKGNVIDGMSVTGYKAAGIPGTVKGMSEMLNEYGTMQLSELIQPAIDTARNGFKLSSRQAETFVEEKDRMQKFEATKKYFYKANGNPYKEGEVLKQEDLAKTLERIAKRGPSEFYRGETADLIVKDMEKNGGLITKADLAAYKTVWRTPVKGTYRGYDIVSMCPPSSGGTHIIQILNIMENANIKEMGSLSSETIQLMAEAERQAYADRAEYMGDPDFVKVPTAKLMDKAYAKKIYEKIVANKDKAIPSSQVKPGLELPYESDQTTHYSVMDSKGNAVSVTYTINWTFGSGASVDGAGFLLNDEMDDFSAKPGVPNVFGAVGGDANAIESGKRPLSSMSPTIILKDGKVYMVVGSPGGTRIITTVLQVISNVIDHEMDIAEAVAKPRFHMQWLPDEIRIEKDTLVKDVKVKLENMGYKVTKKPVMGDVNAIIKDPKTGTFYGAKDPRTEF